jgi:hypothetical protein
MPLLGRRPFVVKVCAMVRRTFLLTSASFLLIAAGSTLGLTHASESSAGLEATSSLATTTTPAPNPEDPSPPGGLGNRRADLEKLYGQPTGLRGTMIAYQKGAPAVTYRQDRASALLVSFDATSRVSLEQARTRIQGLLPPDRVPIGVLGAGVGRTADMYHSDRLATKLAPPSASDPPGEFVVIYESGTTGAIEAALLAVGGIPKTT